MEHFSDKKLHQLKEVFALYDTHGFGLVHVDHLATMIRLMGVNPTEEELKVSFTCISSWFLTFGIEFSKFYKLKVQISVRKTKLF